MWTPMSMSGRRCPTAAGPWSIATESAIVHGGRLDPHVSLLAKPYTRNARCADSRSPEHALVALERGEDRTGSGPLPRAGGCEPGQCVPGFADLLDLIVEGRDAGLSQLPGSRAVVSRVEGDEFADFGQGEPGGLGGSDEAQALDVLLAVSAHLSGRPRRLRQQASALVVADSFDPDSRGLCEAADRV